MLDKITFKTVVENTPLISIDLCLLCGGQLLLGRRTNDPLKDEWFTPGGRIHKNEAWQDALLRIAEIELGLSNIVVDNFALMGMWDHFYGNSALDHNTSTHYVNMPHFVEFKSKPQIVLDDQHGEFKWFDLSSVSDDREFHLYIRNYATWLLNREHNKHD
jgi:colanic acid biosynthesis protein WcaH